MLKVQVIHQHLSGWESTTDTGWKLITWNQQLWLVMQV